MILRKLGASMNQWIQISVLKKYLCSSSRVDKHAESLMNPILDVYRSYSLLGVSYSEIHQYCLFLAVKKSYSS